jgi:pimeloyl-ACP methyl ester carboxylesterase
MQLNARAAFMALLLAWLPCKAAPDHMLFPGNFVLRYIETNGTNLHVRIGGKGSAVVLLHGFGETGDMWVKLATELSRSHTVVVPDLRGMGLSAMPADGYDKKTQGQDIAGVLDALGIQSTAVVSHDIGNMVAYAFASQYPQRVTRFAPIDAPLPGIGPWDEIARRHALWHWSFWGVDAERLVAGRERIYLDRFWNEFTAPGNIFSEASRAHYAALYARPGAMHTAFEQFKAFDQDVIDNQVFAAKGKLPMPVLAIGGGRSYGPLMAVVMRTVASDVTECVIPNSGHWLTEERPTETIAALLAFLN